MNILKSFPYHSRDADHPIRRFSIVLRTDGKYSIADEYYYRSADENGLIYAEGWATIGPDRIFANLAVAEQEILRLIDLEPNNSTK